MTQTRSYRITEFTIHDVREDQLEALEEILNWEVIDYNKNINWTPQLWDRFGKKHCPKLITNISLPMWYLNESEYKYDIINENVMFSLWVSFHPLIKKITRNFYSKNYGFSMMWVKLFEMLSFFK